MLSKLFFLVVLVCVFSINTLAQPSEKLPELLKLIQPSVVTIKTFDSQGRLLKEASGFFVSYRHIITNKHVIDGFYSAEVTTLDGYRCPVTEYLESPNENMDLVKLTVELPENETVDTKICPGTVVNSLPSVGQKVIVIGNPQGLGQTVSDGIVSGIRNIENVGTFIQLTAPISQGSSGSPVFNMDGDIIGIATFYIKDGQNLNFAIPATEVVKLFNEEDGEWQEFDRAYRHLLMESPPTKPAAKKQIVKRDKK